MTWTGHFKFAIPREKAPGSIAQTAADNSVGLGLTVASSRLGSDKTGGRPVDHTEALSPSLVLMARPHRDQPEMMGILSGNNGRRSGR